MYITSQGKTHNMIKHSRGFSKKKLLVTLLATLLLIVTSLALLEKFNVINMFSPPLGDVSTKGPTPEEIEQEKMTNAEAKQEYLDDVYRDDENRSTPTSNDEPGLTVTGRQDGSSVTILARIQSVADGKCVLSATNGTKNIMQEAAVIYQPEFSSCAGFSEPVDSLGTGLWAIKLTIYPIGSDAISKSTTVEVR